MFRGLLLLVSIAPAMPFSGAGPSLATMDAPTPSGVHSTLSSDRAAHALGGFWTAGAGYALGTRAGWSPGDSRVAGLAAATTASVAKEAFDTWVQDEEFSEGDLLADALGAVAFLAISALAGP